MIRQLLLLQRNHPQVQHPPLGMSIHFLLPRSLFLRNFSIDADRFLLINVHIDTISVCVSRLALYIRPSFTCVFQVNCSFSLQHKPSSNNCAAFILVRRTFSDHFDYSRISLDDSSVGFRDVRYYCSNLTLELRCALVYT